MPDILIQNGWVVDGSGGARYRADVAIKRGRIAALDLLPDAQAETVIDATGCVVTPGFVDAHSHADMTLAANPTADSLVYQGITTAITGQCGFSPAPLLDETREQVVAEMQWGDIPVPYEKWSTLGSYFEYLAQVGISLNIAPLVGHGMVRAGVMGFVADPPNDEQMSKMQDLVSQAMREGAIGVSTGLIYPPGSHAATDELIAFTQPAAEHGGFYFSHVRDESSKLLEAVAEAIRVGRETGAAVQISHFKASGQASWDKAAPALALIDQARAEGLDVTADVYPYLASSTFLSAMLPQWAFKGGKKATLERLADTETRQALSADLESVRWDKILISSSPKNRDYEGRFIADMAAETGKGPLDWAYDALLETELDVAMVHFGMSEDNLKMALRHPAIMIGTDGMGLATQGPLSKGKPHPRNYGTYPCVLGRYVREQGVISLEEAVWKMCGLPAQKLRWTDRGLVKNGYRADLVVFDPDAVADQATYKAPHQYPVGIHHVIVNGELVIHAGVHTQARPGIVLG